MRHLIIFKITPYRKDIFLDLVIINECFFFTLTSIAPIFTLRFRVLLLV